jgi:hypothetical protein
MRCQAKIMIGLATVQCERNAGIEHLARQCQHEVRIEAPDKRSGVMITWSTYRVVKPMEIE